MAKKAKRTIPGRVKKIIERPNEPKKAEITIERADPLYSEIRVENKLQDETGEQVELEPGQEVDVTIEADENTKNRKAS